jgi:hypothetical protein
MVELSNHLNKPSVTLKYLPKGPHTLHWLAMTKDKTWYLISRQIIINSHFSPPISVYRGKPDHWRELSISHVSYQDYGKTLLINLSDNTVLYLPTSTQKSRIDIDALKTGEVSYGSEAFIAEHSGDLAFPEGSTKLGGVPPEFRSPLKIVFEEYSKKLTPYQVLSLMKSIGFPGEMSFPITNSPCQIIKDMMQ